MVAQGCLQSLANGLGEEIFRFNEHSQLVSEDSGLCVVFTGVGPAGGVSWDSCQEALDANNGKSTLKFTGLGQIRFVPKPQPSAHCKSTHLRAMLVHRSGSFLCRLAAVTGRPAGASTSPC